MKFNAVLFDFGDTIGGANGIPEFVKKLIQNLYEAGYRIGVISNSHRYGDARWLRRKLADVHLIEYLEVVLGSGGTLGETSENGSAGCHKPDKEIYLRACSFLRVPFKRCVFVGDTWDADITKPASLGMSCLHVNVNDEDYTARLWELLGDRPDHKRNNVLTTYQVLGRTGDVFDISFRLRDINDPIKVGDRIVVGLDEAEVLQIGSYGKAEILDNGGRGREIVPMRLRLE